MDKQVRDLYDEILTVVRAEEGAHDTRFTSWIKCVDAVNTDVTNGYAFDGPFVDRGTVEVEVKPRVFLAATARGSRQYHTTTYNVVVMDGDGALSLSPIKTTDKEKGWALRIRDQVAALLDELAKEQGTTEQTPAADALTVVITGDTLRYAREIAEGMGMTVEDAIETALERFWEPTVTDAED